MNTSWICKIDANTRSVDDRGGALQFWFTYTVGTLATAVHLATAQYGWDERPEEVSGIFLDQHMPIQMHEAFLASEYDDWFQMCQYWVNHN